MTMVGGAAETEPLAELTVAQIADIELFLRTGEEDAPHDAWSLDGSAFGGLVRASDVKRAALIAEVARRSAGARHDRELPAMDFTNLARRKVTPMVTGFFRTDERETVLATLEKSLVFLTRDNIATVLEGESFLHSAWGTANLYLDSIGAEMLGPDAVRVVGMSQGTTCYVSPAYFTERDRFADFVVHEVEADPGEVRADASAGLIAATWATSTRLVETPRCCRREHDHTALAWRPTHRNARVDGGLDDHANIRRSVPTSNAAASGSRR